MPLAVNDTYQNVFYDYVLDSIRDVLISEFNYGKIYIAPNILYKEPFQIRIWGLSQEETDDITGSEWQKEYKIEIVLALINQSNNEQFFKQLYQDSERIYQSLWNNFKGSYSKTITFGDDRSYEMILLNGIVSGIEYNIDEEDETIDGMHTAIIDFTVLVSREDN